ncbi:MAG: S9 family peptidase [Oligoflexia bacterium]|nr:S9 family peptidase [Oligoflexia bacterium]
MRIALGFLLVLSSMSCSHLKTIMKKKHPLENKYTYQKISDEEYRKRGLIPLQDFFKKPEIAQVQISPNGKYLAYLKPYKKRLNIYVKKIGLENSEKRLTSQTERDIRYFFWKENDTLVFIRDFGGDENWQVFRVSAEGENEKSLTPVKGVQHRMVDDLEDVSKEEIIISSNQRDLKVFDAYRLNVQTGEMKLIAKNPGHFISWMADHEGRLRVAFSTDGVNTAVYYRSAEDQQFQLIFQTSFKNTFFPVMFDFSNKNLYVKSNINRDKIAIQLFNPKTKKVLKTIFSHPKVDAGGIVVSKKRKKLLGLWYIDWRREYKWLDQRRAGIYKDLSKRLSDKEITIVSKNKEEDLFVVSAGSDRDPGAYYLYDVESKKLDKIAEIRPWLRSENLAEMKPIHYQSRDGLKIHAYLTLPKGSSGKDLPLVAHPHGGPQARDIWRYNPTAQFLASRGYAVLQMNFRGSTGYGKKFWMAGFKQWGQAMQDDITDGVNDLIKKGIANKNKVCIYGASYGGYAVLAGVAFTPDLYVCGVDYVGISNLFTVLETIPPYWEPYREMIYEKTGHPVKDKELLTKVSPVFHVDKIKAPLFVVHGANDPRVKKAEADQIVSSLFNRGIKPLYMVKYDEGHGFHNEENNLEFYTLMEQFLKKYLQ